MTRLVWHRAWERVTLYLPLTLMGLLALATWWLVRNAPQVLLPETPARPTHEADYFMRDFSVKSFDADGRLQSVVRGRLGQHYPDTDTLEIDHVDIRSTNAQGRVTTATARRAISNADGSEVTLLGDAVVERAAPQVAGQREVPVLRLQGQRLQAWAQTERVRSDDPVTLVQGGDMVTADTLDYDNKAGLLRMDGHVRGLVQPRQGGSRR
ncbi:MAG: LPS export ABC transporter periplasmic protein LptC [Comamonas sp. SCN 67-35]|mgnify:FL=1|uniref:LPS export ABC transporter periplasmic protein LptC n=1 Tax=unclassified Comamonas TaxID=2638500 RepID=UPI00086A822A|nr:MULTISPECIES: LPS export ABC transporter periplasmic protein LptC [unclassified Comamonas]MBN9331151.1 LPS export ABC transporter periplasmic protein LptC [Comamonas sp.]ODU37687.1 MAG: LPS export ABC transporter periplasmic protein LptC [Comamonas sp. SCN 67-35]OJX02865.1 MAG: LPS export ABC transporter periplasmic protein LptC [Burkholderiales bacterium 66-26]